MLLLLFAISALFSSVCAETCFYQKCLGCRPHHAYMVGSKIECDPSNWVSPEWVHNLGQPAPGTASRVPIEYRCLKMVASPDDTSGNTVDVIRGCVPRAQVDSVCLGLVAVERARGHSDARCFVCHGDFCNSAWMVPAPMVLLFSVLGFLLVIR